MAHGPCLDEDDGELSDTRSWNMPGKPIAALVGLFAVATAWPAAPADEPPPDPEAVLRAAGLVLHDQSYILESEIEAASIKRKILQLENGLLRMERSFLSREPYYRSRAKETGEGADEFRALNGIVDGMAVNMADLWRETQRYPGLAKETEHRYTRLAADPQIKAALRALNKGRHPKRALGPVSAHDRNVAAQSGEILRSLGYRLDGSVYLLTEEDELIKLGAVAQRLWRESASNERQGQLPGQAAPPPAVSTGPSTPAQIAAQRLDLVQCVRALRRRADALQKRREELLADGEAVDAVEEINRTRGKTRQLQLGTDPRLRQVLEGLKPMERAIAKMEIPQVQADTPPPAIKPPVATPRAPKDITKLPAYKVLHIGDGDTFLVQTKPGQMKVRLLGVAAPPFDSPPVRIKFLQNLIRDQLVALEYGPGQPSGTTPVAAWVYRVSDGLPVNLEVVRQGYGVPADDAPAPLASALWAAEQEARLGERGLWSSEARKVADALLRKQQRQQEDLAKERQSKKEKKEKNAQKARDWMAAGTEQVALEMIDRWAASQRPSSPGTLYAEEQRRKAEERRREEEERRRLAPEINAGPAAAAVALLVAGMLMLADRRRRGAA
jgi:endonuclease YncB( thermonuclease family)